MADLKLLVVLRRAERENGCYRVWVTHEVGQHHLVEIQGRHDHTGVVGTVSALALDPLTHLQWTSEAVDLVSEPVRHLFFRDLESNVCPLQMLQERWVVGVVRCELKTSGVSVDNWRKVSNIAMHRAINATANPDLVRCDTQGDLFAFLHGADFVN